MTGTGWALTGCLVAGATTVGWPSGQARRRLRHGVPHDRQAPTQWSEAPRRALRRASSRCGDHPRGATAAAAATAATLGWLAAGPVAALTVAVYATLAARAMTRRRAARRAAAARARTLDELCALSADLRAGLPPTAGAAAGPGEPAHDARRPGPVAAGGDSRQRRIDQLVTAVWRLADRTGAPAADLLERIEADARAADRARAGAAAQAAGARATALLLAGLPVGGLVLGYGIGVDPLQVLLHTPLGAACAGGAVLLQVAGLAWTTRLTTGPSR